MTLSAHSTRAGASAVKIGSRSTHHPPRVVEADSNGNCGGEDLRRFPTTVHGLMGAAKMSLNFEVTPQTREFNVFVAESVATIT